MIHFDFDWSDLLNELIVAAALAILPLQLWLLVFKGRGSGKNTFDSRMTLKLLLNTVLWLSILAFIGQPYLSVPANSKSRILVAKDVPSHFIQKIGDSLKTDIVNVSALAKSSADTLVIVGQNFDPAFFASMQQLENKPVLQWIPYFGPDLLQGLSWKGIVRKGEMQRIDGSVFSSRQQVIQLKFGGQTLDSAALQAGFNDFKLKFPAFTQGRSTVELAFGGRTLDTLHFFTRPSEKLTVRFLLESPDFETRALATWLGKNGNGVRYDALLSKGMQSSQNINAAKEPDVIITDASNAGNAAVKKALNVGKSVLLINIANPAAEISAINRAVGTRFQVRKISNELNVKITSELNALPFQFSKTPYQLTTPTYPVAVEKQKGKVGISLLTETFPMQLTGDSVAYERVWNSILALVRPVSEKNLEVQAPVFTGLPIKISANDFPEFKKEMFAGPDTVFMEKSAFNPKSGTGTWLPQGSGWVTLKDSIPAEIFVEKTNSALETARMREFVHADQTWRRHRQNAGISKIGGENNVSKKLPDWFWFAWLLLCFAALWVEAKF